ncbi:MAG: hypothetical protein WC314_21295 [Vulcanimicrobiota bacterium]
MSSEEDAEPWDLLADALGSLNELEDDDVELNLQESSNSSLDQDDPYFKVPLEQASNLILIRRAVADLKSGAITRERYVAIIRPFVQPLQNGLQLMETDVVKNKISEIPEEQRVIFQWMHERLAQLSEGMNLLFSYRDSGQMSDVDRGLQIVEEAMKALDQIQDAAIEAGQEEDLRAEMAE